MKTLLLMLTAASLIASGWLLSKAIRDAEVQPEVPTIKTEQPIRVKTQRVPKILKADDPVGYMTAIIKCACKSAGLKLNRNELNLMLETIAVETDFGQTAPNITQVTEDNRTDMANHFIKFNPKYSHLIAGNLDDMVYSIKIARLHYIRTGLRVPSSRKKRAELWKNRYNSHLGGGSVEVYMRKAALYLD